MTRMGLMDSPQLDDRGVRAPCASCGTMNRLGFAKLDKAARCGHCHTALGAPSVAIEVSDATRFDQAVAAASVPVVVDFWAPWCAPCRMVTPELAQVAAHGQGQLLVLKVNTDAVPELADRFRIRSIPTLAVWVGGREAARSVGVTSAADIEAMVRQAAGR